MDKGNLEQAKKRNAKVRITDVAIAKVPFIEYKGLTMKQNKILRELAKTVLLESKDYNNSNEVAITFDLDFNNASIEYAVTYGTENEVDVCADTLSYHILRTAAAATVVILHNHPSTKTFSLNDLRFFLRYVTIKLMVVVTNQGTIHYIMKDHGFDLPCAIRLYNECIRTLSENSTVNESYAASLLFLKHCGEAGLFYS